MDYTMNHLEINGLEVDDKRNEVNVIVKERRKGYLRFGNSELFFGRQIFAYLTRTR